MALKICLTDPNGIIWDSEVSEIVLPGLNGQLSMLPGHTTLISILEPGLLRVKIEQNWKTIIVLGGVAAVSNDVVIVVVSSVQQLDPQTYNYDQETALLREASTQLNMAETKEEREIASNKFKIALARTSAYPFLK